MILQLKQLRARKGLTQDELADLTGLSKSFLSQLETGARQPSTESLSLLSAALNVSEADLIAPQGFADPAPETSAHRVLRALDTKPQTPDRDFKIGTDGELVQIIATVNKDGLKRLIKQLEAMQLLLDI